MNSLGWNFGCLLGYNKLGGGFKYFSFSPPQSKWESSPNRGENKIYLKPPPRIAIFYSIRFGSQISLTPKVFAQNLTKPVFQKTGGRELKPPLVENSYTVSHLPISKGLHTHRIHGTGIFTYVYHKSMPNVGKYTRPMHPMGYRFTLPNQLAKLG